MDVVLQIWNNTVNLLPMDYNHIALFISVVEAGSISEAARRLNIAKSNLSRALAALEKATGSQLVYRNTRHFRPTEAGISFYDRCKGPFFEIKIATDNIKQHEASLKGKFVISTAIDVAQTILPAVIADFSKGYPKLHIELRGEDRTVDLIKEGVDLALRMGILSDSNLMATKISDTSLILVATAQYLGNFAKLRAPEQLSEHRMISFNKKYEKFLSLVKKSDRQHKLQKIRINTVISVNSPLIAKALAMAGQGVALIPDIICFDELKTGSLVRVLPELSSKPVPFHYVWPAHNSESAKVRAFIDFSKDTLRKYFILSSQH